MHCSFDSLNYKKQYVGSYQVLLATYYTYSMVLYYVRGVAIGSDSTIKKYIYIEYISRHALL